MTDIEACSAEILKRILSLTFTGSIMSFFLFIIKPIIKDKLPRSFQYYMWFSVVIALILPLSKINGIPVSNDSVLPMKSMYDVAQWISDAASETPVNYVFTLQNVQPGSDFPSIAVILFVVWQLGMILVLGFNITCYVSYARKLGKHNINADRQETELLDNLLERKSTLRLYKNPMVGTPILIGFFRPAVILPDKEYEDIKLRNIFMHEITHMKRHDIFIKWLLIFVGAVHWFNPIVYFVRREMNKACELACDESVIKRFDINEMQQYGDTLIAVAADSMGKMPFSIAMFENKRNLKERLGAIMKHKEYSKRTIIAAGVILIMLVCSILAFSTVHSMENGHSYVDNFPSPQDQKYIKEIELRDALRDYDKKNIVEAYVYLSDLEGEITNAYVMIVCREKNPDSEMQSGVKALAAEQLGLDLSNIYVDYMDLETFTSS